MDQRSFFYVYGDSYDQLERELTAFKNKFKYDPLDFIFWDKETDIMQRFLYLESWSYLTEKHKCQFAEISCLIRIFCDLFNNHYEDLFLFALTNHNIPLWTCFFDKVSIFYFASHKDEIIGYKERFFLKHNIDNRYSDRLLSVEFSSQKSNSFHWNDRGEVLDLYDQFTIGKYELVPGIDPISIVKCLKNTMVSTCSCEECKLRDVNHFLDARSRSDYFFFYRLPTIVFNLYLFWKSEMEDYAIDNKKEIDRLLKLEEEEEERKRIIAEEKRKEEERKKAALEAQRIERERQSDFNYINRHNRDALITVSSSSHCQYQGITLKPVTDFVAEFFPKFNKEARAKEISIRTGRNISSILQEWDMAVADGTRLHDSIDKYYHHKQGDSSRSDFHLFLDFARDHKLTPYRSEWTIFDEESELVGTVDFLDYSNGFFTLYDWKRSKNLIDEDGVIKHNKYERRMGYYPISDIEDLPFWHYALQQNIYRYILRKCYGIPVKRMKLVVLHPSLKHYEIIDAPNMEDEVNKMIKTRL